MASLFAVAGNPEGDTLALEGIAELELELFGQEATPQTRAYGRYVPIEKLGHGAHGVVYAAFDPELRRKVAIKLLRTSDTAARLGEERLLREAHALSRVSHPNVVPIFDIGRVDHGVYLVMKLIDGQRLDTWWRETERGWLEVSQAFVQAGRALEAAHQHGIVHRDFKPSNVLVEQRASGPHVSVLDFGLAFGPELSRSEPSVDPELDTDDAAAIDPRLTATGITLGTPLYMAPEQHLGEEVDGRSDQYSFCASLYEALLGPLPWAGASIAAAAKAKHREPSVPRKPGVPVELSALLERGLQPDPAARFGNMTELVRALEGIPRKRTRRKVALWASVAIAVPLAGLWGQGVLAKRDCDAQAAAAHQALPAQTEAELRTHLSQGPSYAATSAQWALAELAGYRDELASGLVESCRATRVHSEQPQELRALRDRCLNHRVDALATTTQVMLQAEPAAVVRIGDAIAKLPDPSDCAQVSSLRARTAPWASAHVEVEQLRIRAEMRGLLGEQAEATTKLAALADEAEAAGDRALLGRLQLSLGNAHRWMRNSAEARDAYQDALINAEASGDAHTVTRVLAGMASAYQDKDTARFEALLDQAAARTESIPESDAFRGQLALRYAHLYALTDRNELALASANRAHEIFSRTFGPDHPRVADAALWRARILTTLERPDAADAEYADAERIYVGSVGPTHPRISKLLEQWGTFELSRGRFPEARAKFERLEALATEQVGADTPPALWARANTGVAMLRGGDPTGAKVIDAAFEGLAKTSAANGVGHAELLMNASNAFSLTGDLDRGSAMLAEAEAMLTPLVAEDHGTLRRVRRQRERVAQMKAKRE